MMRKFILACSLTLLGACATRAPVPVGVVPDIPTVAAEDEQYGHEVLAGLAREYPLVRDDAQVNRVRDIVEKITAPTSASSHPWHVYVLESATFKNAAATRGNYIFVWSGLLDSVRNDDELATIVSHEIAHVLAGHTTPTSAEAISEILSSAAGSVGGNILVLRGAPTILGDLASTAISTGLQALVVNPEQRRKELEADRIGLFLLADAGIDPAHAVAFWDRVKTDPNFSGGALEFLSTHPSSDNRLHELKQILPLAEERYLRARNGGKRGDPTGGFAVNRPPPRPREERGSPPSADSPPRTPLPEGSTAVFWTVEEDTVQVRSAPDKQSRPIAELRRGERVAVDGLEGRWLRLSAPYVGYVRSRDLAPEF